jgi:hypothetical protein
MKGVLGPLVTRLWLHRATCCLIRVNWLYLTIAGAAYGLWAFCGRFLWVGTALVTIAGAAYGLWAFCERFLWAGTALVLCGYISLYQVVAVSSTCLIYRTVAVGLPSSCSRCCRRWVFCAVADWSLAGSLCNAHPRHFHPPSDGRWSRSSSWCPDVLVVIDVVRGRLTIAGAAYGLWAFCERFLWVGTALVTTSCRILYFHVDCRWVFSL